MFSIFKIKVTSKNFVFGPIRESQAEQAKCCLHQALFRAVNTSPSITPSQWWHRLPNSWEENVFISYSFYFFSICQRLCDLTKRQDDIAVADMAVDMEVHIVADMEVDKVAHMASDKKKLKIWSHVLVNWAQTFLTQTFPNLRVF